MIEAEITPATEIDTPHRRTQISPEELVRCVRRAQEKGQRAQDLAKELGMKPATLSARLTYYRKRGVNIPYFPTSHERLDVEKLNKTPAAKPPAKDWKW